MAEEGSSPESSSGTNPANSNPCSICLSPVNQESYLDRCFHKFCYNCIIKWANVVARKQSSASSYLTCPFCKTENFSIIYGYDGASFQRLHVGKSLVNSGFFSEAHRYRLKCYYTEPGNLADKLQVSRYWKFRKYLQQNNFLPEWLRREIQALTQEEDADVIMHHILGVIDSLKRNWLEHSQISMQMVQEEFRVSLSEAVRPFFTGRTGRFVNELELFLASGLNIYAFDKVYLKHLGWLIPEINADDDESLEHTSAVPYMYFLDE